MPKNYDKTDLLWTFQGDYYINEGDLADTYHDPLRSLVQEIRTRTKSEQGDWASYPELGATLRDFVGKLNNKFTAEDIKSRLISALGQHGFVNSSDIKIMYAPVGRDKIMFRLSLSVASTPANANSATLGVNFVYDYAENNVLYV